MAFKMKGSPHKMGKIQGTSKHTSALKQKEAEVSPMKDKKGDYHPHVDSGNKFHTQADFEKWSEQHFDEDVVKSAKEDRKAAAEASAADKSPAEMKSPLEQNIFQKGGIKKHIVDPAKKVGKFLKEGKVPSGDKVGDAIRSKVAEYKPKSETTVSKELTTGPTRKAGDPEEKHTRDKLKVTATTNKSKKKLFGGKKKTTTSSSKKYDQNTYVDGDVERGHGDKTKQGNTTTVHTRNKRRGGGKKKVVTIDQNTGKKTVTRYKKDGSVKSTKVKKGDHSTYSTPSNKKALREENKGK